MVIQLVFCSFNFMNPPIYPSDPILPKIDWLYTYSTNFESNMYKIAICKSAFCKNFWGGLAEIKQPYSFWYNSNTGLCKLCTAVVMYRFHCNDLPGHFQNYFTLNSSIHEHLTRSHNKLHIPYARAITLSCQLRIAGPKLWNNIDPTIKITSLHLRKFKQVFKNHLLSFYIWLLIFSSV
jgi:hypothetical protein